MKTQELLTTLTRNVHDQSNIVQNQLLHLSHSTLGKNPAPEKWNALQCMEHLNKYARHYLPAFEKAMLLSLRKQRVVQPTVKSTWLGRKCITAVLTTNTKKMKTPKRHNPIHKALTVDVLNEFLQHQQKLLLVLQTASTCNLNQTKVAIEIMPLLKLNLGEFLQFFVYHQSRHLAQAVKATQPM